MTAFRYRFASYVAPIALALVAASASGCAAPDDDEDALVEAEGALATGRLESLVFELAQGTADVPAPDKQCTRSGKWTLDFSKMYLEGKKCDLGRPRWVGRWLEDDEIADVKRAMREVRVARRLPKCTDEAPIASFTVKRNGREYHYVEARGACTSEATPVTAGTLVKLTELIERLGQPDQP
jgi:hypothetical protein